jgi:hypothetical protein
MDIPLVRRTFMWLNNQDPPSWSRIDRFLVSPNWEAQFHQVFQMRSDHLSILLDCKDSQEGKKYFKFENMWLKSGIVERVKQWWSSYHFQGSPSLILAHKLKALKADLKV